MLSLQVPLHRQCRRQLHMNENIFAAKSLQKAGPSHRLSQEGSGVMAHQVLHLGAPCFASSHLSQGLPKSGHWVLAPEQQLCPRRHTEKGQPSPITACSPHEVI